MFRFSCSLVHPLRPWIISAIAACLAFQAAGPGSSRAAEIVLLSKLDVSKTVQSTGRAQINKSYVGRPLTIAGRRFQHGVGTHAISTLAIDLKGGADRFTAFVGVDDDNGKNLGTVEFRLIGDGRVLWRSGIMNTGDAAKPVDVDLKGVKSLILRVSDTRDGIGCDHADWAEAKFAISGEKPETVAAPPMKRDQAVILTPKPPAAPRINGAKAFSARPGHPYLFTIPATGQRPMEYTVDRLPAGLKLDPKTGQIRGALNERGVYPVTFRVTNAVGQAERPFKIVCGDTLALTPHMGWNSWYVWGRAITQDIMQQTADAVVATGLIDHGYMYVNVDDCWTVKPDSPDPMLQGTPRDVDGNIIPNKRFPDMKAMADYIHRKGLKAGIYTGPSAVTCALHTGSKGYEEQDARQYARWGYDFLKYDPTGRTTAPRMGAILQTLERDMVFNIVGGDIIRSHDPSWARPAGVHSWRTGTDLGGSWRRVIDDLFGLYGQNKIQKYHGPGGWNDPDYISIGYLRGGSRTSLTPNQQYSYVSIWCLLAAPLIFSGDVMRLDEFTSSLLTNDEVIEVDQDLLGKPALRVAKDGGREVWAKDMEDGRKAVGLFNLDEDESEQTASVTAKWSDLGITGKQIVRDLWRQKDLGVYGDQFSATVEPDGVMLLSIRPQP